MQNDKIDLKENGFQIVPANPTLKTVINFFLSISFISSLISFILANFLKLSENNEAFQIFYKLIDDIPNPIISKFLLFSSLMFIASLFLRLTIFRKPKFDTWIEDIVTKQLSSKYIWYKGNKLYIDFDRNLNKKHIMDFIKEITDKSDFYTYYYNSIDINQGIFSVTVTKKEIIPLKAVINKEKDTVWNIIPLGEAVDHRLKTISPICWYLNNNTNRNDVIETIPSTSILISGGTGSGKSVLQQCIVGHISRFPDNYMLIGCDVKQVEFNNFIGVSSIKKIALTIEEVQESIKQARNIMYDRFSFMKDNKVNNIYNLDKEVDYYTINGKDYQFDELFSVSIDGVLTFMKVEDIFKALQEGKEVEIDENYSKL